MDVCRRLSADALDFRRCDPGGFVVVSKGPGKAGRDGSVGRAGINEHLEKVFASGSGVDDAHKKGMNVSETRAAETFPGHQRIHVSGCRGFSRMTGVRPRAAAASIFGTSLAMSLLLPMTSNVSASIAILLRGCRSMASDAFRRSFS